MGRKKNPGTTVGANQHRNRPLLDDLPNLAEILQKYANEGIGPRMIPSHLRDEHGVEIAERTVKKYMKQLGTLTTRRSGLTDTQKEGTIDLIAKDDPLGRWGGRHIQEKLKLKSVHIPSMAEILTLRRLQDPEASAARHPRTRKVHQHGIWSIGPDEEWCVDGHEKLVHSMGIAVWGIIDKFSRMEITLYAMPNARVRELPPAIFLRVVKEKGGMPLTVTGDKGGELGLLISLVTTMRQRFQPFLPEDRLPAFKAVKSTYNITRERAWRPIWEKPLGNLAHEYKSGKVASGFIEADSIHSAISSWLWGKIVQEQLNEIVRLNQAHKIRKQRGILLPSGARRIDLYSRPSDYGAEGRLIDADQDVIDALLEDYDRPDLLMFGSEEEVAMCEKIFVGLGRPKLSARQGWAIFAEMVEYFIANDM